MGRGDDSAEDDSPVTDSWVSASGESEAQSVGASIARAQISQALFGKGGLSFGRFILQRPLGSGGMGVVYEARDPELDREVALKLVPVPADGGESALSEAKALARLAHPNVVPIYDVGIDGDYVFIVMELVRGETLKRWVRDRRPREIVKAYLQAGEAIAAAHDKGLVHRDFKPANAIMGADGRVRVVDFGLAFQVADAGGAARHAPAIAGTPRYMAPEQTAGAPVTAAADQFSFCVALAEAFGATAEAPRGALPRWLERIVARGTAPDPAARFPTMRALLKELANDPVTVWRRRALVSGLVVVGATAFVAGRATFAARDPACAGLGDRLSAAWGGVDRGTALARLANLDAYGKSLHPFLATHLDDHARRWIAGYEDACIAHRRELQSDVVFDRRVGCLERSRAGLKSFAEIVASSDAKGLPAVALALQAIPDPKACSDVSVLETDVDPPPAGIAKEVGRLRNVVGEAQVQVAAGRFEDAQKLVAKIVTAARALGYRPLVAEALLVQGHAAMSLDQRAVAIPLLREAARIAFETGPRALAVEAWARRAWVEGTMSGQTSALAGEDVVEAIASNSSTGGFARALLHNNLGGVELAFEHEDRARAAFERALEEARSVEGPGAFELVSVRVNLAMMTGDPARRDDLLVDAENAMARLVGAEHPEALSIRWARGLVVSQFRTGAGLLEPLCSRFETQDRERATDCWSEVGYLKGELGDRKAASEALGRAIPIGSDLKFHREAQGYLSFWQGDPAAAAARFGAALAERPAVGASDPFWIRIERARLELGLGRAERATGHALAARRALRASLETLVDVAEKHPAAPIERLLGRARAELAKTMAVTGAAHDQVAPLARSALAWLSKAGGDPSELQELERLTLGEERAQR